MTIGINDRAARKKALVVGISDYTSLQKLDFCKNDGTEVCEVLSKIGYEISDKNKLVGEADGEKVKDAIYDFFGDIETNPDDTLLFYYSGHGVPDVDEDIYLASSDIDPDEPYRKGFSFDELTKMVRRSVAIGVVVILDCCYSGSAKMGKGSEEDAAGIGRRIIEERSRRLSEVEGKYILSASQALQEAYALKEEDHSIYTHYLLEGLEIKPESIDNDGNLTPQSLHKYVYRKIMSLPFRRRPRQRPGIQGSGNIVLVSSKLRPAQSPLEPVPSQRIRSKAKILIPVLAIVIAIALTLVLSNYYNHSTSNMSVQQMLSDKKYALYNQGDDLLSKGNYTQALPYLNKALAIDPKFEDALFDKGDTLNYLGNYTGALTYVDKALAIDPNDKYALSDKGWALSELGNYTQAIQYLDKALAIDPQYKWALNNKGWALNGLRNYTGAIKYYDKALAVDPTLETALYNKGDALNSVGNYTQALSYLNKALAIDPKDVNALTNKGLALDKLGNHTYAIGYYDKALAIDPKDKLALILKIASMISKHNMATLNTNNITHNSPS